MPDRSAMGIFIQSHVTHNGESPGRLRPELADETNSECSPRGYLVNLTYHG
jgi:hypothetical protein